MDEPGPRPSQSRMTQLGSRVCIATIKTMMFYSLSLAPLASFNRWRGWNTAGAFHRRTPRPIQVLFAREMPGWGRWDVNGVAVKGLRRLACRHVVFMGIAPK